jgi:hypothetical protein
MVVPAWVLFDNRAFAVEDVEGMTIPQTPAKGKG